MIPLNKYLSLSGVCSRRFAVEHIKNGVVQVNGVVIKEPGFKVKEGDIVAFKKQKVTIEKKIYILLNKPRDYVTTLSDEKGRKTVIDLVKHAAKERIYPVGRLDRATTGLLLMTNDGGLAQKLSHPKYEVKKVYSVVLTQELSAEDLKKIKIGVKLIDGKIAADKIGYILGKRKTCIKIQIHSGKKRVVRRIFEALGYEVVKLDRVNYAGLTKRGLLLGRWRYLSEQEVESLKVFGEVKRSNNELHKSKKQ